MNTGPRSDAVNNPAEEPDDFASRNRSLSHRLFSESHEFWLAEARQPCEGGDQMAVYVAKKKGGESRYLKDVATADGRLFQFKELVRTVYRVIDEADIDVTMKR